jgi:hypothetical protein
MRPLAIVATLIGTTALSGCGVLYLLATAGTLPVTSAILAPANGGSVQGSLAFDFSGIEEDLVKVRVHLTGLESSRSLALRLERWGACDDVGATVQLDLYSMDPDYELAHAVEPDSRGRVSLDLEIGSQSPVTRNWRINDGNRVTVRECDSVSAEGLCSGAVLACGIVTTKVPRGHAMHI